jgi:SAM-dependent methyltransferase
LEQSCASHPRFSLGRPAGRWLKFANPNSHLLQWTGMPSFLEACGRERLSDIFGDNSWVSIHDQSLDWLELPSQAFLDYAENRPRLPFDGVPPDPKLYRDDPTFLILQAHRVWLTVQTIARHLPHPSANPVVLDIGAFPFVIDLAIRDFLRQDCRIIATINQALSQEAKEALQRNRIEEIPVNLDPLVKVTTPIEGMTDRIPLEDSSVDLIIFSHVIEHLYHPRLIVEEMCRVLKKGGKIVLSTDNAFLIGGFLNYLTNGAYLHEPVEITSAMVFTEWRGHVRFFSEMDLRTLLERSGMRIVESRFHEALYNSLWKRYFVEPFLRMPRWRADLLSRFPEFRNEIMMVAQK